MTPVFLWFIRNVWTDGRLAASVNLTLLCLLADALLLTEVFYG